MIYLLKWVGHEAGRGFAGFWDAPFFYPSRGVLAWSDHMLGPGLAATAWNAVVPGWVGAYNILFLSSFALTAAAMAWVLRRSGRSVFAALLGGALYAFCPFRWDQLPHLQVLMMAAVPLTLWTFDRLLALPTARRGAAFLACYALHLSGGCYLAVMIHIPLLVLALNRLALPRPAPRQAGGEGRRRLAILGATLGAAAALLTAAFWQYWRAGARSGLSWSADAQRHWGASLLSYLQPSDSNLYAALWPRALFRPENCLFPGWLATGLCVAGLILWRRGSAGGPGGGSPDDPGGSGGSRRAGGAGRTLGTLWRFAPLALVLPGWIDAELWTWSETPRFAGLARWVWWRGYTLPLVLVVAGAAGWALASRRRTGRWPWAPIAALAPWPRGILLAGAATALLATPLFYLPLARVIPGFNAMRVPARFQAFTMVSVVFFAAAACDAIAACLRAAAASELPVGGQDGNREANPGGGLSDKLDSSREGKLDSRDDNPAGRWGGGQGGRPGGRHRGRAGVFLAAVAIAAAAEVAPRPLPWVPVPEEADFPPVNAWLAAQPDVHALLELPLADAGEEETAAALRAMYFGTLHWRPLVNGYSAHFGPLYERLTADCCFPMPEGALLADLRSSGVTHILIHRSDLAGWQLRALDAWAAANHSELVHSTADDDCVYRLLPAGPKTHL